MKRVVAAKYATTPATAPAVASSSTPASALKVQPSSAFTSLPIKRDTESERKQHKSERGKIRENDNLSVEKDKEKEIEKAKAKVRLSDMLTEDLELEPTPSAFIPSMILQTPMSSHSLHSHSIPIQNNADFNEEESPSKDPDDGYVRETSIEAKFSGLQLTYISAAAIVNALSEQVQAIDLSQNQIEAVPNFIPSTVLGLDLSHNLLKDVRVELKAWDSLIELNLSHNQISSILSLEILYNIQYLNLGFNKIQKVTGLENMKELKVLKLENNQISTFKSLRTLSFNKILEEVDLRENPICIQSQQIGDLRLSILALIPTIKIINTVPVKSKYGQMVKGYASAPPKKPATVDGGKRMPMKKTTVSHRTASSSNNSIPQDHQGTAPVVMKSTNVSSVASSTASLNLSLSISASRDYISAVPGIKPDLPASTTLKPGSTDSEDGLDDTGIPNPRQLPVPQPLLAQLPSYPSTLLKHLPVPAPPHRQEPETTREDNRSPTLPPPPPPPIMSELSTTSNTPFAHYHHQQHREQHDGISFSETPNDFHRQMHPDIKSFNLNESAIPFYHQHSHAPQSQSRPVHKAMDASDLFAHSVVDLDDGSPLQSRSYHEAGANEKTPGTGGGAKVKVSPPPTQQQQQQQQQQHYVPNYDQSHFLTVPSSSGSHESPVVSKISYPPGTSPHFYHVHGLSESPVKGDQHLYRPTSPPFDTSLKSSRSRTPSPEKARGTSWKKHSSKKVTPLMKKLPWRRPPEPALRPVKSSKQSQGNEKTMLKLQERHRSPSPAPLQRTNSPPEPSPPPPHPLDTVSAPVPPKSPEQRRLEKRNDAMSKFYQWHQRVAATGQDPFSSSSSTCGFDVLQIHGMHHGAEQSEVDDAASSIAPSLASNSLSGMSLSMNPMNLNFQSAIAHKLAIIQEQEEEMLHQQEEEDKRRQLEVELNTSPVHIPTYVPAEDVDKPRWMSPLIKGRVKPPKPAISTIPIENICSKSSEDNIEEEVMQSLLQPVQWEKHLRSFTSPERAAAYVSSQFLHDVNPMKEMSQPSPTKATKLRAKAMEDKKKQEEKQDAIRKYKFAKNKSPAKMRPHKPYYQDPKAKKYSELYEKYASAGSRVISALIDGKDDKEISNDEERKQVPIESKNETEVTGDILEEQKDAQLFRERLGSPFKQLLQFKERVSGTTNGDNSRKPSVDQETLLQAYDYLRNLNPGDDLLASASQINDLYDLLYPSSMRDSKGERIMQDYYELVKQRAKILKHIQDNYTNTVPMIMSSATQQHHHPIESANAFHPIPILHHPTIFEQKGLTASGEVKQDEQIVAAAKELNAMIEELKIQQIQSLPPDLVKAALGPSVYRVPSNNMPNHSERESESTNVMPPSPPVSSLATSASAVSTNSVTHKKTNGEPAADSFSQQSIPIAGTNAAGMNGNPHQLGTLDILNAINELRAKQMTTLEKLPSPVPQLSAAVASAKK